MPWLVKGLLLAFRTKRGRQLLLAGGMGAIEIARSKRARDLYGRARRLATNRRAD